MGIIDFHTHTLFSDGVLIPAELIQRASQQGYSAIAVTDHADASRIEFLADSFSKAAEEIRKLFAEINIFFGVEITHVPPAGIASIVKYARERGLCPILVHGETIVEPVAPGTNRAAIEAGVDILAHPGLITLEECRLAREKGVCLEITTRGGHSLTNPHVLKVGACAGADMIINTDTHQPCDLMTPAFYTAMLQALQVTKERIDFQNNSKTLMEKLKQLL